MTVSLSVLFFPRLLLCLIEDHVQVCFASKSRHLYPPVPLSLCIEEKFTSQSGDIGNCIWIRFVPKSCPCNWKHKYHHDHYKPLMASKYLFALVTSDCLPLSALALIPVVNNTACQILEEILFFVSSVRSSKSHPDLLLTQHQHHHHPTFSDHTGPQHWTFTFWATTAI